MFDNMFIVISNLLKFSNSIKINKDVLTLL